MPLFETGRGTRRELSVPGGTGWDDLDRAQRKHMELLAEQKLLYRTQGSLSHKRKKLEESDRLALADPQFNDPKAELEPNPEIEKIAKELDAVKRRAAALDDAIDRAELELVSLIEANREAWAEEISPEVDAAFAEYAKQIDALEDARRKVAHKNSVYWWLRNFSSVDPKLASYKSPSGSWVLALKQMNEEPYLFATVIDALRQDATRIIPTPEEQGIPWGDKAYRVAQAARTPA
jgi:hypothetical protein